jgi:RNA polymerase sigma-70 factor (ECF subfamily)
MDMNEDTDLILKVAGGDQEAFLKLYDRYSSKVYALALRMMGESMTAEEVTQDAFLKLWSRAASFNPDRGAFLTWMLTITRRTALDRIRFENRRPKLVDSENVEHETWHEIPDVESTSDEARWRSLRFAVMDLPIDQRYVIELAYFHGLSQSQIAEHISIPLGTVKTRMRLGMEKIRRVWLGGDPLETHTSGSGSDDVDLIEDSEL